MGYSDAAPCDKCGKLLDPLEGHKCPGGKISEQPVEKPLKRGGISRKLIAKDDEGRAAFEKWKRDIEEESGETLHDPFECASAFKAGRESKRESGDDKCPDCGADMIEVCSGLENMLDNPAECRRKP